MAIIQELAGQRCLIAGEAGPLIADAEGARRMVEEAFGEGARVIAAPACRLDPAFFKLRSGIAGEVMQKVVQYHMRFAVLGDISAHVAASDALRDFVYESNRGRDICFVADVSALEAWLSALNPPAA